MQGSSCTTDGDISQKAWTVLANDNEVAAREPHHGLPHARDVWDTTTAICSSQSATLAEAAVNAGIANYLDIISIIAIWHDWADLKLVSKEKAQRIFATMISILGLWRLGPHVPDMIVQVIKNVSFSKEKRGELLPLYQKDYKPKNATECFWRLARDIVSDADKIAAIGKGGWDRCVSYTKESNPTMSPDDIMTNVIKHCHEKLLHLRDDYIRTDAGKALAEAPHQYLVDMVAKHSQ